jgi:hypothetical protein
MMRIICLIIGILGEDSIKNYLLDTVLYACRQTTGFIFPPQLEQVYDDTKI